eukprot:CAMPEP_0176152348 /NCGR_PEP_ID=MMETSP0120_2-20121206/77809_1 /TAXON_ID=160619 /ORGANISM="Kryptoperidinium foliaceum, Strain CCMP 1326" /LENGTH=159 /DNA_ID=CAMNT_0017489351 /DNA_START=308 /DNA_END=784 /DNA_ORIENTATION=+
MADFCGHEGTIRSVRYHVHFGLSSPGRLLACGVHNLGKLVVAPPYVGALLRARQSPFVNPLGLELLDGAYLHRLILFNLLAERLLYLLKSSFFGAAQQPTLPSFPMASSNTGGYGRYGANASPLSDALRARLRPGAPPEGAHRKLPPFAGPSAGAAGKG